MEIIFFIVGIALIWAAIKKNKEKKKAAEDQRQRNAFLEMTIQNDQRIIIECVTLIENSKNLDTVLSRLQFLYEHFDHIERDYSKYGNNSIVQSFIQASANNRKKIAREEDNMIKNAIFRAHKEEVEKSLLLKTEKGRKTKMTRFYTNASELLSFSNKYTDFLNSIITETMA